MVGMCWCKCLVRFFCVGILTNVEREGDIFSGALRHYYYKLTISLWRNDSSPLLNFMCRVVLQFC